MSHKPNLNITSRIKSTNKSGLFAGIHAIGSNITQLSIPKLQSISYNRIYNSLKCLAKNSESNISLNKIVNTICSYSQSGLLSPSHFPTHPLVLFLNAIPHENLLLKTQMILNNRNDDQKIDIDPCWFRLALKKYPILVEFLDSDDNLMDDVQIKEKIDSSPRCFRAFQKFPQFPGRFESSYLSWRAWLLDVENFQEQYFKSLKSSSSSSSPFKNTSSSYRNNQERKVLILPPRQKIQQTFILENSLIKKRNRRNSDSNKTQEERAFDLVNTWKAKAKSDSTEFNRQKAFQRNDSFSISNNTSFDQKKTRFKSLVTSIKSNNRAKAPQFDHRSTVHHFTSTPNSEISTVVKTTIRPKSNSSTNPSGFQRNPFASNQVVKSQRKIRERSNELIIAGPEIKRKKILREKASGSSSENPSKSQLTALEKYRKLMNLRTKI